MIKEKKHILSDDKQLLMGFVGWRSRLTMASGYIKKLNKRKPITKNN